MSEDKPKSNKWVQYGGWVLGAIATVVGSLGYITPEQLECLKSKSGAQTVAVADSSESVGAMTPEQIKELAEQMKALIEQFKKLKPAPQPQPTPEPVPVPPPAPPVVDPVPAPTPPPAPSTLKAVITDEAQQPLEGSTVEAGKLFMVTASTKDRVGWAVSKHGDVKLLVLPNNLGYAFSLQGDAFVEFFLTDVNLKAVSTRITCNQAPQPPPIVDPKPGPKPDPAPVPPVPKAEKLKLAVVYDIKNMTPDTAKVLAATDIWDGFEKAGHKWIFYPNKSTEPGAIQALADAGPSGLPKLVVYDLTTGAKLAVLPLPAVDELDSVVKYYGGKSE